MKILFVDIQYDYGIQSRGPNHIGQEGFKKSLEKLGHEVVPFYYDEYLNNTGPLQKKLLSYATEVKPDLIFFVIFREHFHLETLKELKNKFTTVNWFGDDQWRFDSFTSVYAPYFTWSITTDQYAIDKYRTIGVENVFFSQWAAIDQNKIPDTPTKYKYDVSFVGAKHPYRVWFTKQLRKKGIHVECFGYGWPNGPLGNNEMGELFANSRINLNLSNSNCYDIRYLLSSPYHIAHTIKSRKGISQIKARNFEIPFFNGFQLTNYAPSLENYFDIGKEIVCFSDIDDATMLIKHLLSNNEEREKIKRNGHIRAVNNHGYYHRLRDFFNIL